MTLVEVVAAIGLIGTVLATLMVARARLIHQRAEARMVAEAIGAADRLLSEWWDRPNELPRSAEGWTESEPRWRWRTRVIPTEEAERLGLEMVRLELLSADGTDEAGRGLVRVEVIVNRKDSPGQGGSEP